MNDISRFFKYFVFIKGNLNFLPDLCTRYFAYKIFKKPVLSSIELAITYSCQAKCHRCSCRSLIDSNRAELTFVQIKDIISRVKKGGVFLVNITGGEPTLRNDLTDIIRMLHGKRLLISLTTNAMLLSKDRLKEFKKSGLRIVQLSLDSPDRDEHDASRGLSGNYDKIMESLENARDLDLKTLINVVMTKQILRSKRLDEMREITKKYKSFLSLILPVDINKTDKEKEALDGYDIEKIRELARIKYFTSDIETSFSRGRCPAGNEKLHITPYGDVFPCPFIHATHGNVLKEDILSIWERMRKTKYRSCIGAQEC